MMFWEHVLAVIAGNFITLFAIALYSWFGDYMDGKNGKKDFFETK